MEMVDLELRDEPLQKKYDFVVRSALRTIDISRQESLRSAEIRSRRPVSNAMAATPVKQNCFMWLQGNCPRGEKCHYLHAEGKKGSQPSSYNGGSSKGKSKGKRNGKDDGKLVCRFFESGNCHLGEKCDFLHKSPENAMVCTPTNIEEKASPAAVAKWIGDTGAAHHLVCKESAQGKISRDAQHIRMATANGTVTSKAVVDIELDGLKGITMEGVSLTIRPTYYPLEGSFLSKVSLSNGALIAPRDQFSLTRMALKSL